MLSQQLAAAHQPSPRLVPLPPSLSPSPVIAHGQGTPLALPPPSPALSEMGFPAFDDSPSTLQDSTFNFAQHHQFEDPPEESPTLASSVAEERADLAPLDPPPSLGADYHLPPSPTSLITSASSQMDVSLSDYSPSPSIASVRMAQLVTRLPPHRMLPAANDPSRLSVATSQSGTTSSRLSITESDEEEEGATVFGARRLSRPAPPVRRGSSPTLRTSQAGKQTPKASLDVHKGAVDSVQLKAALEVKSAQQQQSSMVKSASETSVSSWRENLDSAVRVITADEADPSVLPASDSMMRMKSILGPKMKIISKAPWDSDASDTSGSPSPDAPPTPPKPRTRSSIDALRNVAPTTSSSHVPKLPTKENDKPKPKSSSRSKSFSMLTSRKAGPSEAEAKASKEALRGLGLGGVNLVRLDSSSSLVGKTMTPPIGQSFLDLDDEKSSKQPHKAKSSAPAADPTTFTFPPPPSNPPSPPKSRKSFGSKSRPPPITFDMISPSAAVPLASPTSIPRSAPPHMASFVAVPRSDSAASLGVRAPKASTSGSSLATSAHSSSSSPSTPTGLSSAYPSSPTSPTSPNGSYFGSAATSPTSRGPKLISLEEARERERLRMAAAAARREKAMTPVEHIAGKEEVIYGGTSKDRTRESTADSMAAARSRAISGPVSSSASVAPSHGSSPSTSTVAAPPPKTLKAKKSGFLRRMMGVDRVTPTEPSIPSPPLADLARFESSTASTLATSPPYSVTISSPHASLDLGRTTPVAQLQGGLTPSPSVSSAPTGRISFLPTPTAEPELRTRKGLAPSLSLRPVSMAFSAGLPFDFLASAEAASKHATAAASTGGASMSPTTMARSPPLTGAVRPTSPVESLVAGSSAPSSAQSPFAPSFNSSTTGQSSLFDRDDDAPSSVGAATPLTPFPLSSSAPDATSPLLANGSYAALQEEYARARKAWQSMQWELETQVRVLQSELEQAKAGQVAEGNECTECGTPFKALPSPSIVQRPRFKGHGGSGTLYGSSLAA